MENVNHEQLKFESHRHTALARKLLGPGNIAIFCCVEVEAKSGTVPEYNTLQECNSIQEKVFVVSNV